MAFKKKRYRFALLIGVILSFVGCDKGEKEVLEATKRLLDKEVLYIEKSQGKYVKYIFEQDRLISCCSGKKESL